MRRVSIQTIGFVSLLLCALLALPATLHAQPLADRVPAGALIYVGWGGTQGASSAFAQSRLKAVLESTDANRLQPFSVSASIRSSSQPAARQ